MDDATRTALEAEQAELQDKLKVRSRLNGYGPNCLAIQARLDAIAKQLADG